MDGGTGPRQSLPARLSAVAGRGADAPADDDTAIRRDIDQWCAAQGVRPRLVGEFEDYALLRVFGRRGAGVFPVFAVLEADLKRHYGLERVGVAKGVTGRFNAISVEKKVRHPAVVAICEGARRSLFAARGSASSLR